MKVYELMAILEKCKAGAEVYASRGLDTHCFATIRADIATDEDYVYLIGDESKPEDKLTPL